MIQTAHSDAHSPGVERMLVAWSALGTAALLLVPLLGPVVLAGSMVMPLALADRRLLRERLLVPRRDTVLLLVASGYLAINATWSLAPRSAAMAVAVALLATAALHVGAVAFALMRPRHLAALVRGLVIGLVLGLAALCFEYVTHLSGQRALARLLAALNVTALRVDAGTWEAPHNTGMTRNLGVVVLMVWIGAAALIGQGEGTMRRLQAGCLVLLAGVSVMLSPSATAKIGFLAGLAATVAACYVPRLVIAGTTALWVALCATAVPIAHLLDRLGAYTWPWIAASGRHRILIWAATSEWYWQAPVLGAGVASARGMPLRDAAREAALNEISPSAYLNWHAHNAYLQVWFETGAVGALLMLGIGLLAIHGIRHTDESLRPGLCGAFACLTLFIATGFSLWAAWYLSALAVVVLTARLVVAEKLTRTRKAP
ncbi:MAG: O-antigen ligase family protein [Hyphomicrobiaceae bacterium]|nr:O-antigen ligase family protein [Hyphomicrobiaceae bacterium]